MPSVLFAHLAVVLVCLLPVVGAYFDALEMLGVNLAVPEKGDMVELARQAAKLGVVRIKLFDFEEAKVDALRVAFAGKKLEIMVALPLWDRRNTEGCLRTIHRNSDIVKAVAVWNEPCLQGLCKGADGEEYLHMLNYMTEQTSGLTNFQVTTPFSMGGILTDTYPPQNSRFKDADFMKRVVTILRRSQSPLTANLYPYLDIAGNPDVPENYALGNPPALNAEGVVFFSQVDADIKSLRFAISRLGSDFGSVPVQIGETGWAHSGGPKPWGREATRDRIRVWMLSQKKNAQTFVDNIAKELLQWKWKDQSLHGIYLFQLADEPLKPGHPPAYDGEKYFGITALRPPWRFDNPNKHAEGAFVVPRDWFPEAAWQQDVKLDVVQLSALSFAAVVTVVAAAGVLLALALRRGQRSALSLLEETEEHRRSAE
eukprot:TRINITY_DN17454_c0_g1_i2.p1 TRINITY_DN17454_c0_g1~~TRINITY_DN17454_c0_g1_i2.p1  ORF type:complete len:427 (-),score=84.89 TRINITY_DN17454_c0_g1_i2:84-1364(-)